jgi:hypothetical protein
VSKAENVTSDCCADCRPIWRKLFSTAEAKLHDEDTSAPPPPILSVQHCEEIDLAMLPA